MLRSLRQFFSYIAFAAIAAGSAVERMTIDHDYVRGLAAERARAPFRPNDRVAPDFFRALSSDDYRRIRLVPGQGLWAREGLSFQTQFFHPGGRFSQMLQFYECTESHVQEIPFNPAAFDYGNLPVPFASRLGLGYAGFRLMSRLDRSRPWTELVSFLGGSFIRGAGWEQRDGIAARGLALNCGGPGPEEIPAFTQIWLMKPAATDTVFTAHALLESPSVAGAYTFNVAPGMDTTVEVLASLFFRRASVQPGLAPMSGMVHFGESALARLSGFRPGVHDSAGLLIASDPATRIWRPLESQAAVQLTDFDAPHFAGFGLLRRARDGFPRGDGGRAGLWVEPIGQWPAGRVRLVEMATRRAAPDNVAAFWAPSDPIVPGRAVELGWRLHWSDAPKFGGPPGWVSTTRQTNDSARPGSTSYVIDFDAASLSRVPLDTKLEPDARIESPGRVEHQSLTINSADHSRRLIIVLAAPAGSAALTVSARLLRDKEPITETWTTRWQP